VSSRSHARLAWGLAGVAIACALMGAVFLTANGTEQISGFSVSGISLGIGFSVVGALIASRRPDNAIGWIFCAVGLSQGVDVFATQYTEYGLSPGNSPSFGADVASWLALWAYAPGFGLLLTFLILLYPDGRLPSRRWVPVACFSAAAIGLTFVPVAIVAWGYRGPALTREMWRDVSPSMRLVEQLQGIGLALAILSALACVVALIRRFRRSSGEERAQLKWFTYTGIVTVAALGTSPFMRLPQLLDATSALVVSVLLPTAVAIAILKYRLYDIDLIINRTLVYGALTAVLAGVYAVGVVGLGGAMRSVTGQEGNSLAVAASTLAVAALFRPARSRLQGFIDRRFYRNKYDATKTLESFGSRLRDEVDLDELTGDLLVVVKDTMQPAHASLWLRAPGETG
jgi:hypothetical protein